MIDPPAGKSRAWTTHHLLALVAVVLLGGFCLLSGGSIYTVQIPIELLTGWFAFLRDAVPRVRVNWDAVLTALVCLGLLLAVVHRFGSWLYREMTGGAAAGASPAARAWQTRWTGVVVALVVVTFVAGIATAAIAHQVAWLARSPEPVLESSWRFSMNRSQVGAVCYRLWNESKNRTAAQVRAEGFAVLTHGDGAGATVEDLHLVVLEDGAGKVRAIIVAPRDPAQAAKIGVHFCTETRTWLSTDPLPAVVAEVDEMSADPPPAGGTPAGPKR